MAREFRFPSLGTNLVEGEIVSWLVEVGERVEVDQPLVEVETEKSTTEIPSPYAGVVLAHGAAVGESIRVGDVIVIIGDEGEEIAAAGDHPERAAGEDRDDRPQAAASDALAAPARAVGPGGGESAPAAGDRSARVYASPAVRRLAQQLGIDLRTVRGSGPGGKITRADLETYGSESDTTADERQRMSNIRRTIAERMVRSWHEIPHFHTHDQLDASQLLRAHKAMSEEFGQRVPLEALVIRALIPALRAFPQFNAAVDGEELILRRRYDIGVAVDTERGLIVPVVKESDRLPFSELVSRIVDLAARARERRLAASELDGATFTVSNIGALPGEGGCFGTPLVPVGTTAILSIGRAVDQPVVRDGVLAIAPVIPLDLGCDHRAIDGGDNRRFMGQLMRYLSEPALLVRD